MIWLLVLFVHVSNPWHITVGIYMDRGGCQAQADLLNGVDPLLSETCEPMNISHEAK